MAKIGFIGMGNMGYAMLKGALAAFVTIPVIIVETSIKHDTEKADVNSFLSIEP